MELMDKVRQLATRIPGQLKHIRTEEATKNALVMPFINALGYNVFDPMEVTPELVADVGTKKGEKVDYAILKDGKPIMLFECKAADCNLDGVTPTQLYRYFSVTDARIGILTNGVIYRFFSDLEAPNKMDAKPFFEVNMLQLDEVVIGELNRFSQGGFEISAILASAAELKYTREIKRVLAQELQQPSEELVRFFASRVYSGRMTQAARDQFGELTKRALQQFISERVSDRLKSALASESQSVASVPPDQQPSEEAPSGMSDDERDGYYMVRAIVSEAVDPKRVTVRDQQSYCSVLLDDNNRKPICRLWFNTSRRYLGLFDEARTERRVLLDDVTSIFRFAPDLRETVCRYVGTPIASASQQPQAEQAASPIQPQPD